MSEFPRLPIFNYPLRVVTSPLPLIQPGSRYIQKLTFHKVTLFIWNWENQ
ncbi:hypothetical protein BGHDH14_bgh03621 [Blumeria hordei DH14]|uniref:Uncharacterized protein n=1 Tax=Blumeria graminis f. sp. hordei (strain DH14) TaxID=546991 RepID=N1JG33_BLUG1|nr:hypothetical protein BGHDH14_bgh03621 [Blumeria hordei DH14]